MEAKESCCFVRTYSALEGLQAAHTLRYCARVLPEGVVLELERRQDGRVQRSAALCPGVSPARAAQLLQYLSENGVGLAEWQDVLADLGQPCCPAAECV